MMSMLLWWGVNAYVGCSRSSRSVSVGAVGLIERGKKECGRRFKVLWELFIKDHARHGQSFVRSRTGLFVSEVFSEQAGGQFDFFFG